MSPHGAALADTDAILYIDGMGSFARLASFHTDLPSGIRPLYAPRLHPSCNTCQRCMDACPSGALQGESILDAYRCITFHNESLEPFPSWIRGSLLQLIQVMRPPSVFFTRELIFNQSGDGGTHHNMDLVGYKCVQKVCKRDITI